MEILNNFSMIYCFVSFVIGSVFMLAMMSIAAIVKDKEPMNNVHFYVARDKNKSLWLYLGKPIRRNSIFSVAYGTYGSCVINKCFFKDFGLNENDFDNLKWEDEPVEVFIKMED